MPDTYLKVKCHAPTGIPCRKPCLICFAAAFLQDLIQVWSCQDWPGASGMGSTQTPKPPAEPPATTHINTNNTNNTNTNNTHAHHNRLPGSIPQSQSLAGPDPRAGCTVSGWSLMQPNGHSPGISFSFHLCSFHFLFFPFILLSFSFCFPFISFSFHIFSFHFLFFPFILLSFPFHFLLFPFHFLLFPFHFLSFNLLSFPFISNFNQDFLGFFWISHYLGPALDQGGFIV